MRKNLLTDYAALMVLHDDKFRPNGKAIQHGWKNVVKETYYVGRWQVLQARNPLCLADSAHNNEGLIPVIERLKAYQRPLHIVIGVVNDKDLSKALPLFPKDATYYFVKGDIPRGLPAAQLAETAANYGLAAEVYVSVRAGYEVAKVVARAADGIVFVGGSIFTVAEVL